jgi:hypothetical protein
VVWGGGGPAPPPEKIIFLEGLAPPNLLKQKP